MAAKSSRSLNFVTAVTPDELRSLMLLKAAEMGEFLKWQIVSHNGELVAWYYQDLDAILFEKEMQKQGAK